MWNTLPYSACRSRVSRSLLLVLPGLLMMAITLPRAAAVATSTTLTTSSPTVVSPAPLILYASVTAGGSAVSIGSVTFCDASAPFCEDAAVVGKAQLIAGTAQIKFIPAIGVHNYKAVFAATTTAASSTSAAQTVTVTGLYPTTTAITASGNPSGYSLTATVVGYANHPPVLAGTVSFQDTTTGNSVLATAPLGAPAFAENFVPAPGSPIPAGNQPTVAGVGDFNGDGRPDLAILNAYDNTVTVYLGKGDGTFTPGPTISGVGSSDCILQDQPSNCGIAVGDLNGDGHADLAVTSGGDNTVIVLLGHGDATFSPAAGSPITVGTFPEAVKIADFNKDGLLDLVVANAKDNTLSILLGNGDGTFAAASGSPVTVGGFPFFLAVADYNGDGSMDVAATNQNDSTLSILLGNGDGTFNEAPGSPISSLSYNPGPVVAADFNGDGVVDLAVANFTPLLPSTSGDVVVMLGNGDGTFSQSSGSPIVVGVDPFALATADFNQDGKLDLAVDNYGQIEQPGTQTLTILFGDGKGAFTPAGVPIQLGNSPNDLAVADFNEDGTTDLAIPNLADFNATILLNVFTQTSTATANGVTIAGTGTHYVDAMYPGNTSFAPSTSSTVPLEGQVVPTTLTLTANPIEQMLTMPVTLTAQLAVTSVGTPSAQPTGTVTFFDESVNTQLGTAPMGPNGQAVFSTISIGPGVHVITASFAGDANYLASASNTVKVTIDELMITRVGNNNTTILPGTTVVYTLQVTPQVATAFLYNVSFTAAGLPVGAVASFSPVTLAAGSKTAQIKMTVETAKSALNEAPPSPFEPLPLALGLLLPLFGSKAVRKRLRQCPHSLGALVLAVLSLAAIVGLSGCAGAGLFAARKVPFAITVTATEGTLQRSTKVPLAIQ